MWGLEGTKEKEEEREGDGRISTTTDRCEPLEDGGHPFLAARSAFQEERVSTRVREGEGHQGPTCTYCRNWHIRCTSRIRCPHL